MRGESCSLFHLRELGHPVNVQVSGRHLRQTVKSEEDCESDGGFGFSVSEFARVANTAYQHYTNSTYQPYTLITSSKPASATPCITWFYLVLVREEVVTLLPHGHQRRQYDPVTLAVLLTGVNKCQCYSATWATYFMLGSSNDFIPPQRQLLASTSPRFHQHFTV
jgi:hypothetical protein